MIGRGPPCWDLDDTAQADRVKELNEAQRKQVIQRRLREEEASFAGCWSTYIFLRVVRVRYCPCFFCFGDALFGAKKHAKKEVILKKLHCDFGLFFGSQIGGEMKR